ncbi:DUF1987 domain-containing protein [Flavobacteriales bacterium]|jgi:hypothetical protein|nr:DUF1987 domain-containing protein [Flavobacteriales bacterium]
MHKLFLEGNNSTPEILFDDEANIFEIKGMSRPENATKFYAPVLEWMDDYLKGGKSVNLVFKMVYFNTASSKLLLHLAKVLERGSNCEITWLYEKEDEDMMEAGLEFKEIISLPFKLDASETEFI